MYVIDLFLYTINKMLKNIKYYIQCLKMFCCVEKKSDFCNPFSEREDPFRYNKTYINKKNYTSCQRFVKSLERKLL